MLDLDQKIGFSFKRVFFGLNACMCRVVELSILISMSFRSPKTIAYALYIQCASLASQSLRSAGLESGRNIEVGLIVTPANIEAFLTCVVTRGLRGSPSVQPSTDAERTC